MNASHPIDLFTIACHHISINAKALSRPHKNQEQPHKSFVRSGVGLTLEKSAFQIFHGGNPTFINSFDKTKFSYFTLPSTQHHSFFRNWNFEHSVSD